jgi:hypothetical protein
MQMWTPRDDEAELHEWWRPLIEFALRLRVERFPWPAYVDDFELFGRVDRRGKPAIWTYRHRVSRGFVSVDGEGRPYRFISYRKGPSLGRFAECDLRRAAWSAGLPDVVEPVDWPRPPGSVGVGRSVTTADAAGDAPPAWSPSDPDADWDTGNDDAGTDDAGTGDGGPNPDAPARTVRRGHLRLVVGSDGDVASRPA